MRTLIKNADVYAVGALRRLDVALEEGKVADVAEHLSLSGADDVIEGEGLTLFPGLVDMHVHFREPGFSAKETMRGGIEAADAGGFTFVCPMPNLNPAPDTLEHLEEQLSLVREVHSSIKVLPYATITLGRKGCEYPDYEALAPLVAGFSDDGSGVQSSEVMEEAMRRIAPTGKIVAAHCEVNALLEGGYIHKGEYAAAHGHKGICSESEWREIERDINLAARTGARLHICHVSTAEGVELVRQAKLSHLPVTCETGPHYLWFCDGDLQEDGRFKMNPPLRGLRDMEALREGVFDGTVDVMATDHAPHTADEKSRGLKGSAMGVVGLETSFAAVYTEMCLREGMPFSRLVDAMSLRARRILRCQEFSGDGIAVGDPAMLTLVDLKSRAVVDSSKFKGKGRATPFAGLELCGGVVRTVCR